MGLEHDSRNYLNDVVFKDFDLNTMILSIDQKEQSLFAVNTEHILEIAKFQHIETFLNLRLGLYQNRIIRYLNSSGFHEADQIAEVCMIPQDKAYAILNNLQKAGFVKILQISQTSSINSTKSQLKWGFSLDCTKNRICQDLVKTELNIMLRYWQKTYDYKKLNKKADDIRS